MNMEKTPLTTFDPERKAVINFLRDARSPWKMRLYFLKNLPSAFFWGMKVNSLSPGHCSVHLPYGWRTQNPFRSIYFAAQLGAAELSTGLLASLAIRGRGPVSMLVTGIESDFVKKADSLTTFTCNQGEAIIQAVDAALATGQPQQITVVSVGTKPDGQVVSRTQVTWSFKAKNES
ncbi:MAG: DUF4442 domain-containing protein [Saprospiraceae bacterium]|nr:DUF4442 domain-containing protein [Saprospiraceae bacterium]